MKNLRACQYYNSITCVFKKFHLFTALFISAWLMKLNECNAHLTPIDLNEFHSKGPTKTHVPPSYSPYTIDKQPQNVPIKERTQMEYMVDLTNDLTYRIMFYHSASNRNSFAFSPTALMSILIAIYEGTSGESMMELYSVLGLPHNHDIIRIGYRDINRRLRTYFFNLDNPLKGLSLNKENVTITRSYEAILMFYGYDLGADMISSTTVLPSKTTAPTSLLQPQKGTSIVNIVMEEDTAKSQEIENTITPATSASPTTGNPKSDTTTEISTATNIATEMVTSYKTTEENLTTTENVNDGTPVESTTQEREPNGTSPVTETTEIYSTSEMVTSHNTTEENLTTTENVNDGSPVESTTQEREPNGTSPVTETTEIYSTSEMVTSYNTTEENLTTTENVNDGSPVESTTQEREPNGTSPVTETTEIYSTTDPATKTSGSESGTETSESESATETTKSQTGTETTESEPTMETTESEPITETTESETAMETTESETATETTESIKSADLRKLVVSMENSERFARLQRKERVNRRPSAKLQAPLTSNIKPHYLPVKRKANHPPNRSKRHSFSSDNFDHLYITILDDDCTSTNPFIQQSNICKTETDLNTLSETAPTYADFKRDYNTIVSDVFYLTNQDTVNTNFKLYNTVLYYKYFESLRASVLELELDTPKYNLMIFLPEYNADLITAARSLHYAPNLRLMRKQLKPTLVQAIIPDFKLEGNIFLTNDLQNMGVVNMFEPNPFEFCPMTHEEGVYVKHIEQSINVHIRTNPISQLTPNNGAQTETIPIAVNHPFMFFIIDRDLDVAVMAGRVLNPLNIRIQ